MQQTRAVALSLLAMLIVFFVLFLFAEVMVRGFALFPGPRVTAHPLLGSVMIPGATLRLRTPEFDTLTTVNSLGFPDAEHTPSKPAGVLRIAFLGDSFVEAAQVNMQDRFDKLIERSFREQGLDVETLNFGVGGFGTDQEYLTYHAFARNFSPDVVVLFFVGNDLRNNIEALEQSPNKPYFTIEEGVLSYRPPRFSYNVGLRQLLHKSFILTELANTIVASRKQAAMEHITNLGVPPYFEAYLDHPPDEYEQARELTARLITELADDVREDGATFVLVSVPLKQQVHPDSDGQFLEQYPALKELRYNYSSVDAWLRGVATEDGMRFVELAQPLKERCIRPCYVVDGHWNAEGIRRVAEVLQPVMEVEVIGK